MLDNSRRSIFPQMNSYHQQECFDTLKLQSDTNLQASSYFPLSNELQLTQYQFQSSESAIKFSEQRPMCSLGAEELEQVLAEIEKDYYKGKLECVKSTCKIHLNRLRANQGQNYIKIYINSFRKWLGMAYLKNFQSNRKIDHLKEAKKYLKYNEPGESAHKRAKRLNNLGLCELFLNQNSNSFQYFSKALQIYHQDKVLNLLGLLKNITELYRRWEMYDEAVKIYKEMLEVSNHSVTRLSESEQQNIIVLMLQCSNLSQNEPNRKLYFYRARDLVKKVKETEISLYLNLKLRLQLITYGIKWGIEEEDCSQDYVDDLIKNIQSYQPKQPKLMFLQAQCYYKYREVFSGQDWKSYRQYSEYADQLYHKIQNS